MQLFHSPASPFVRKVLVAAHELGLAGQLTFLPSAVHPVNRDATVVARNPLGQVPTLLLADGTELYDSRVICEYLDSLTTAATVFPAEPAARWTALRRQALGDGMMGAAVLVRYELVARPEGLRWPAWADGQMEKVTGGLRLLEGEVATFGDGCDIGLIAIACAVSYLDLRFPDDDWRARVPGLAAWYKSFSERPSMRATVLRAPS